MGRRFESFCPRKYKEAWPSGLRHITANDAGGRPSRRFESSCFRKTLRWRSGQRAGLQNRYPPVRIRLWALNAVLTQSVERLICNEQVVGSIWADSSKIIVYLHPQNQNGYGNDIYTQSTYALFQQQRAPCRILKHQSFPSIQRLGRHVQPTFRTCAGILRQSSKKITVAVAQHRSFPKEEGKDGN